MLQAARLGAHEGPVADQIAVGIAPLSENILVRWIYFPHLAPDEQEPVLARGGDLSSVGVLLIFVLVNSKLCGQRLIVRVKATGKNAIAVSFRARACPRNHRIARVVDRRLRVGLRASNERIDLKLASLGKALRVVALGKYALIAAVLAPTRPYDNRLTREIHRHTAIPGYGQRLPARSKGSDLKFRAPGFGA